ncbi:hypothetical protein [uncultured Chryseobacterium sp.]|nr:hypothetical protein [uncultured Chryseobacterium sp.]
MGKKNKIKPEDNVANMQNPNEGLGGTNEQYDKDQENRKKQQKEKNKK